MTKRATVDVTIYDDETGVVEEKLHIPESSTYGWEIEREFEKLGERIGRKIDPLYYRE